jgi:hypothetical protein
MSEKRVVVERGAHVRIDASVVIVLHGELVRCSKETTLWFLEISLHATGTVKTTRRCMALEKGINSVGEVLIFDIVGLVLG